MTTDELLEETRVRGFEIFLRDGELLMRGDLAQATEPLLATIKHHRQEILRRLTPQPPREWIWKHGWEFPQGHTCTEDPQDHWFGNLNFHPAGAWFWRYVGEPCWRPVPGRGGMHMIQVGLSFGRLCS